MADNKHFSDFVSATKPNSRLLNRLVLKHVLRLWPNITDLPPKFAGHALARAWRSRRAADPSGSGDGMSAPLILCIEDEPSLRDDIAAELAEAGYDVIEAADACDALEQLDDRRPDLILCDIVMPGMDGHALLTHLRSARPELNGIPFVFLTALSSREQMIAGRRAGADD